MVFVVYGGPKPNSRRCWGRQKMTACIVDNLYCRNITSIFYGPRCGKQLHEHVVSLLLQILVSTMPGRIVLETGLYSSY
jgi:hypothetical protein